MLFDKLFILILNLIVIVKVANYYGTLGYGTYQYAVSIVAIFDLCLTFIDSRVVKKRYIKEVPGCVVWNATIARLLFSGLSLFAVFFYLLFCNEDSVYTILFVVLLSNSIICNLRFGMQNRYEYLLKTKKVVVASNLSLTLGCILQLFAVYIHMSIISIAFISALSSFVTLSIVYIEYYTQDLSILLKYNTFLQSVICSLNLRNIKWLKKAICAH
ncbi:hypothetical protein [Segatella bryantii]|uniref:hypothetical protein n=1 Tax=Segatella bryantii TaxID=77095 RepID=UPI00242E6EA1|nr:hypothetical protein [Segatella bryantii]